MTDEEMAEEYAITNWEWYEDGQRDYIAIKRAFLAGLKAGKDEAIKELKEKLAGAERTRDNLRQIGFPTFQSCKEYADKMNYAKAIIKGLLDNSDEYARQRAIDFLKEE